ncbi:hypothetical protein GCM10009096_03800 [Parasphingorhabdus litoris]|uniref:HTH tetR-type domain-containing protein n=1 Tax=Parasphingorhabdus litoris TaxID=394733 RepID=A0ABN1A345_9SPHN|nr:TetR/AcrR family transcriptional regulator [Parasphingorhabdus litoris]
MTKKATTQQNRGIATREAIIAGALELIGSVGLAELNHRSVAKTAKVSLARTTYYFESRDDIIVAAQSRLAELDAKRFAAAVDKIGVRTATREGVIRAAMEVLLADLGAHRPQTTAYLELGLEAARSSAAQQLFDTMFSHRLDYFRRLFECAGISDPEERARIYLSCYLGLVLQELSCSNKIPDVSSTEHRMAAYLDMALRLD